MKEYSKLSTEISLAILALSDVKPSAGKSVRSPISGAIVAGREYQIGKDNNGGLSLRVPCDYSGNSPQQLWQSSHIKLTKESRESNGDTEGWTIVNFSRYVPNEQVISLSVYIIDAINPTNTNSDKTIIEILKEWKKLFTEEATSFGYEKVIGLWGELFILDKLIDISKEKALSVWTGPERGSHDFTNLVSSIECKTTTNKFVKSVHISSVHQLIPPSQNGTLTLAYIQIEECSHGGKSLTVFIEEIVKRLDQPADFFEKLAAIGYQRNITMTTETEIPYILCKSSFYDVSKGFPRIVPESFIDGKVPNDVGEISYTIDLRQSDGLLISQSIIQTRLNLLMK